MEYTLEILYGNNVLHLDADLYIKPISMHEISVGFKISKCFIDSPHSINKPVHWVTITDESSPTIDALSKFLMLVLGVVCIPCATGYYHTELMDLLVVLGYGRQGRIVDLLKTACHILADNISAIAWTNYHGAYQANFNLTCNQLVPHVYHSMVTILNATCHMGLKKTNLALLVTL